MAAGIALGLLAACTCGSRAAKDPEPPAAAFDPDGGVPATGGAADFECRPLGFARSIDIAEASGAEAVAGGIAVVADSGHRGAYVIVDAESGEIRERGALPLDEAGSDDIEGLAARAGRLYALTSSGWVREYERAEGGFAARGTGYRLAEPPWGCADPRASNCGPNWEGLCLRDPEGPTGGGELAARFGSCAGFAASKRDGALYCVVSGAGWELTLHPERPLQVTPQKVLSGCAFDAAGRPWAVTNLFGASAVLEVASDLTVTARLSWTPGSSEAVAIAGGDVYRFSDTSGRPSLAGRYRCP